MEIVWKRTSTIALLMLSGCFIKFDCWSLPLLNGTYDDIQNINATYGESDSYDPLFGVTYDDIRNIRGACDRTDSCESPRNRDSLNSYDCKCNRHCGLFGTCCVDSKHRHIYPKPLEQLHCYSIFQGERFYYVPTIYGCDPDFLGNKTTVDLCNSNAELSNNPVLKVPVTDLVTGISYKNYHCFSCNKNYGGQEPIPWKLELGSRSEKINGSLENLRFDTSRWTWILDYDQANAIEVFLNVTIPDTLISVIPYCYNIRVISDCASNWTDNSTRSKCLAYMALTRIQTDFSNEDKIFYYRNPHCAMCNYRSIDYKDCTRYNNNHGAPDNVGTSVYMHLPDLFYLPEKPRFCGNHMVYDTSSKKCRRAYKAKRKQLRQG